MVAVILPPEAFHGLYASNYNFLLRQKTKRISNILDRLYKMGFLRRRITDRQNIVVKGRPRKLGKEYVYRISKQGEQYVLYLLDQKEMRARLKKKLKEKEAIPSDLEHQMLLNDSAEEREIENRVHYLKEEGRYKRFPLKMECAELANRYLAARDMLRGKGVKDKKFELFYVMRERILSDKKEDVPLPEILLGRKGAKFVLDPSEVKELKNSLSFLSTPTKIKVLRARLQNTPVSLEELIRLQGDERIRTDLLKWIEGQGQ